MSLLGIPRISILVFCMVVLWMPLASAQDQWPSTAKLADYAASEATITVTGRVTANNEIGEWEGSVLSWLNIQQDTRSLAVLSNAPFLYDTGFLVSVTGTVVSAPFLDISEYAIDARSGSITKVEETPDLTSRMRGLFRDLFLPDSATVPTSTPQTPWSLAVDFAALAAALFAFVGVLFSIYQVRQSRRQSNLGIAVLPFGKALQYHSSRADRSYFTLSLLLIPRSHFPVQLAPNAITVLLDRRRASIEEAQLSKADNQLIAHSTNHLHIPMAISENMILVSKGYVEGEVRFVKYCFIILTDVLSNKTFRFRLHVDETFPPKANTPLASVKGDAA